MGIRGYVQTKQPEYGNCRLTSGASYAAWEYLTEQGLEIYTPNGCGADSDRWEIQIPSIERIKDIVEDLRQHPEALNKYGENGKDEALSLANLLEEGITASENEGYDYIIIEWF